MNVPEASVKILHLLSQPVQGSGVGVKEGLAGVSDDVGEEVEDKDVGSCIQISQVSRKVIQLP